MIMITNLFLSLLFLSFVLFFSGQFKLSIAFSFFDRICILHLIFTSMVKEFSTSYHLKLTKMSCHLVILLRVKKSMMLLVPFLHFSNWYFFLIPKQISTLLQLLQYTLIKTCVFFVQVNNGDVALERSGLHGESVCYTAENPFHVQLLKQDKRSVQTQLQMPKKRGKSPSRKKPTKADRNISSAEKCQSINADSDYGSTKLSSQKNCKASVKLGKFSGVRCTPEGKRRRRSRLVKPVDLHTAL